MGQPCDPRITVHGAAITGLEGMWRENQFENRRIYAAAGEQPAGHGEVAVAERGPDHLRQVVAAISI